LSFLVSRCSGKVRGYIGHNPTFVEESQIMVKQNKSPPTQAPSDISPPASVTPPGVSLLFSKHEGIVGYVYDSGKKANRPVSNRVLKKLGLPIIPK
jgi:hypothetical protein